MQSADLWLAANSNSFPAEKMPMIREQILKLPEDKVALLYSLDLKNPTTILIISIFLGYLGVDRFMLGDTGMGVGKLLTAGGCGIWSIIDWFLVSGVAKEKNFQLLMQTVGIVA